MVARTDGTTTEPGPGRPATVPVAQLIRTALCASAKRLARAAASLPAADRDRQQALDQWFAGFAAEVRAHFDVVETLVLPRLAAEGALNVRDLDVLAADHAWTDHLLDGLGDVLAVLAVLTHDADDTAKLTRRAADLAGQLEVVLTGQLATEGRLLDPLVAAHFDERERGELARTIVRDAAVHRARFTLPWLLDHLRPEEQALLLAGVPGTSRLRWRSRRRAYRRSAASVSTDAGAA